MSTIGDPAEAVAALGGAGGDRGVVEEAEAHRPVAGRVVAGWADDGEGAPRRPGQTCGHALDRRPGGAERDVVGAVGAVGVGVDPRSAAAGGALDPAQVGVAVGAEHQLRVGLGHRDRGQVPQLGVAAQMVADAISRRADSG